MVSQRAVNLMRLQWAVQGADVLCAVAGGCVSDHSELVIQRGMRLELLNGHVKDVL